MDICYCKAIIKAKDKEAMKKFYNDFLSEDKSSLLMENVISKRKNRMVPTFLLWGTPEDIIEAKLNVDGKYIGLDEDFDSDTITIEYSLDATPNEIFWSNCVVAYDIEVDMFYYDDELEYGGHSKFIKEIIKKDHKGFEVEYYEVDGTNIVNSLDLYNFLIKNNIVSYDYMYNVFRKKQQNNNLTLCDIKAINELKKIYKDFNFETEEQVIYDISQDDDIPEIGGD